jgi:ABC-2 type transport system permease protein
MTGELPAVVRTFLRLKARLLLNGVGAKALNRVAFITVWVGGLALGLVVGLALAVVGRTAPLAVEPVTGAVFGSMFALWVFARMATGGEEEVLGPGRLELLPLTNLHKLAGLFAAALIGPGALISSLVLLGLLIGTVPVGIGALVEVAAALVMLVLCVSVAQTMQIVLATFLRSRRGRDLGVVFSLGLALLFWYGSRQLGRSINDPAGVEHATIPGWLGLLPPGALARSLAAAARGEVAEGAVLLAYGLAWVVGVVMLWGWLLSRWQSVEAGGRGARVREQGRRLGLYPRLVAFLPTNRVGVVAAKELRYSFLREPRQWQMWVFGLVFGLIFGFSVAGADVTLAPYLSVLLVFFLLLQVSQAMYGIDGPAFWGYAVAAGRPRDDLLGKNLAIVIVVVPLVVTLTVGVAAWRDRLDAIPGAILLALAATGVTLGVGNQLSVRNAYPWPRAGQGNTKRPPGTGLWNLLGTAIEGLLYLPVAGFVGISYAIWHRTLAGAVMALAYGAVVWWVLFRNAAAYVEDHLPEVVADLGFRD